MLPHILYKYVAPERIDVLLEKRIRFTQPYLLNDPFEFNPGMRVPGDEGIGHFEKRIAEETYRPHYDAQSRMSGVLCLTEIADSIPMWTHYAAGHRGFAIGFDTTSDLFQKAIDPYSDSPLSRVRYESDRPVLTGGRTHPDTIFFTKSKEWEYEHEWRWLELRRPEEYAKVVAGPEGQLLYLRCISAKDVRRIVLGLRTSPQLSESVRILKASSEYKHLELFHVRLSEHEYKLRLECFQ